MSNDKVVQFMPSTDAHIYSSTTGVAYLTFDSLPEVKLVMTAETLEHWSVVFLEVAKDLRESKNTN